MRMRMIKVLRSKLIYDFYLYQSALVETF